MHILMVSPYYAPAWSYGGPVRVAYEVATRAAAKGHHVTVLTTDALNAENRAAPAEETLGGVRVMRLPNWGNSLAWRRIFLPRRFKPTLRRLLPGADVVHIHEIRSMPGAWALDPIMRAGVPFILSPHGGLPHLGRSIFKAAFDALYGQRLLDAACRVHAITDMEAEQATTFDISADRIVTIPNGIDTAFGDLAADAGAFRARRGIPADARVVGFLGRLNAIKGVDLLVDAFARLHETDPQTHLLLCGPDDGLRPDLERRVEGAGLGDAVTLTGALTDEAVKAAAYRTMDVYVLPSRYEIMGITLLEAMLCGIPVITTSACGLATDLVQHDLGVVIPAENISALHAALAGVLHNPTTSKERAARTAAHVRAAYDWDAITARWIGAYEACTGN